MEGRKIYITDYTENAEHTEKGFANNPHDVKVCESKSEMCKNTFCVFRVLRVIRDSDNKREKLYTLLLLLCQFLFCRSGRAKQNPTRSSFCRVSLSLYPTYCRIFLMCAATNSVCSIPLAVVSTCNGKTFPVGPKRTPIVPSSPFITLTLVPLRTSLL